METVMQETRCHMVGGVAWVSKERTHSLFSVAVGVICNLEQIFQLYSSQFACISKATYVSEKHYVRIRRHVTLMMVFIYR